MGYMRWEREEREGGEKKRREEKRREERRGRRERIVGEGERGKASGR